MSGLSGEDRARLELLAEVCGQYIGGACRRALALIDQQEKEIERLTDKEWRKSRSARATSTKEDGC